MKIKVIGAGCAECSRLKVEALIDIVRLGVLSAPSLMIDDRLVVSGRVAKKEEILKLLTK